MTEIELERILSVWQSRLCLDHWDLKIRWGLPVEKDEDAEAEIRVHDDYDQASLRVKDGFESWSERDANTTIVHELLHCFERGSKQAVSALDPTLTGVLSHGAYEMLWHRYVHESENWIDRLAIIFVDLAGHA